MTDLEQSKGKRLYDVFSRLYLNADPETRENVNFMPYTWDELPLWRKYVFMGTAEELGVKA